MVTNVPLKWRRTFCSRSVVWLLYWQKGVWLCMNKRPHMRLARATTPPAPGAAGLMVRRATLAEWSLALHVAAPSHAASGG
jgi:hypothetical protein